MTRRPYPAGWTAESQARGKASSPGDDAWNVNFDNGNANWNDHDNDGFVRAVRSAPASECQRAVTLQDLYTAWLEARRGKKPSQNQLAFETFWLDNLLDLQERINSGKWLPAPPTCFITSRPKAREIHAPDFADRVVHHWLVPQLEQIFEPAFIHDSWSNRKGKGTHGAVARLQTFLRQVASGQGGGWYLQLDIRNFFYSIHRQTLYTLLKERMARHRLPEVVQRAVHALLARSPIRGGVRYACSPSERDLVPPNKRLINAAPGCGIAIGNLSSQFFANVYLNELDQFVKHCLGARRYLRYVDDFVLIHRDREQLAAWKHEIEQFLRQRLRLELKPEIKLLPIAAGVDFLGYLVRPTHKLVRRRVVHHARERLRAWGRAHVRHQHILATPANVRALASTWSSYCGHFSHAASGRLHARLREEFPWLRRALLRTRFPQSLEGQCIPIRFHDGAAPPGPRTSPPSSSPDGGCDRGRAVTFKPI